MSKTTLGSEGVDIVLRLLAIGAITGMVLVAPNAIQALDKPLSHLLEGLDARQKARKYSQLKSYLYRQGYVRNSYEHGVELTLKAKTRLSKIDFDSLTIQLPKVWDKTWRIVLFDIPENRRHARVALTAKLRSVGFLPLQKSAWIYPFACKDEVAFITNAYGVNKWVSYFETNKIDHEQKLIERFRPLL